MILPKDPFPNTPWLIKAILTAILGGLSVVVADSYTTSKVATSNDASALVKQVNDHDGKIQAISAHQQDDHEQIKEMKDDIRHVKESVDNLSLWALGHK